MEKKTSLNWVDYFSQKTQRADCFGVEKMVDKVGGSFVPSEKEQRDAIVEEMKRERNVGDEGFLISLRWWGKWEKKVGFPSSSFPHVFSFPRSSCDLFANGQPHQQHEKPKKEEKFDDLLMPRNRVASLSDRMESLDALQLGQIDNSDLCQGKNSKKPLSDISDNDSASSTDNDTEAPNLIEKGPVYLLRKEGGESEEGGELVVERKKEVLRRDVDEGVDFVVVSEGVWKLLHSWYGGGPCFSRYMVTQKTPEKTLVVPEIHLCWLEVDLNIADGKSEERDIVTVTVSKKCSLSTILQFILEENKKKQKAEKQKAEKLPLLLSSASLSLALQEKDDEGVMGIDPFLLLKSEFGTQVRVFENIYESIESAKMADLELLSAVVVHVNEEGKDRGVEDKGKEPEVSGDKGNEGQEKEENKSKEKPKKGSKGKEKAEDQPQEIMEENTKEEKKTEVKKKSSIMLRVLGGLGIVKGWGGDSGKARGNEKANGRDPKRDGRREASPRGSSPRGRRGSRGYRVHIHNNAEDDDWPVPPAKDSNNPANPSRPKALGTGLRGMDNLGNTCYMNAAIQCLSHAPHLTNYFLSGDFTRDLNTNNPLGSGGKMAKSYANLLRHLWSPSSRSAFPPRDFRATVTKSFSQFQGHRQHDAQEFLAFLIDSLHEDVNKARNFKYEEYEDNTLPDEEAVALTWERHKKRNQSVLVDRFQGMLKSEINCPVCENASVRFDPCMFLSVPVGGRTLQVKFVHYKLFYYPVKYGIIIEESETIGSILHKVEKAQDETCKEMPEMKKVMAHNMVLCEVTDWAISSTLQKTEKIGPEQSRVEIYAFELPEIEFERTTIVYLSHRTHDGSPFPFPLLLFSTAKTCEKLYTEVWEHIQWVIQQHTHEKEDPKFGKPLPPPPFELDFENLPFELKWVYEKCSKCRTTRRCSGHPLPFDKPLAFEAKRIHLKICWTEEGFETVFCEKIAKSVVVHPSGTKNSEKDRPMTLKKCLNRFSYRELLSADNVWYCNKCRKHVQAWKKMDVWSASDYLIIHLKRFAFKERYRHKITRYVNFPLKGLDMSDICCVEKNKKKREEKEGKQKNEEKSEENFYDLFAVINHHGGASGGHYTSYVQPSGGDKWYHLNDSHVRQVAANAVIGQSAYVLMYRKRKLM